MTNCLSGLMFGVLLGAGVELKAEESKPAVKPQALKGQALNLAEAFKKEADDAKRKQLKKPKKPAPLKKRVLVFKTSWCGTCQLLDREWPTLRKQKWRVGTKTSDHFQLIDVDRHPELMHKYRIGALPTVILMDGNRERARHTYLTARQLADLYKGNSRK